MEESGFSRIHWELSRPPEPSPNPALVVPEIRITLPSEEECQDNVGRARIVIVHVGDSGAEGLQPLSEETLPRYEPRAVDGFHSLDLDSIGGLRDRKDEH